MAENPNSTPDPSENVSPDKIEDVEGVVKWFDRLKGFGFIIGPSGQDIFVHFQVIVGTGFRALNDGSTVTYSAEKSEKGWKATKVVCKPDAVVVKVNPNSSRQRTPRR